MKRFLVGVVTAALVICAAAFSGNQQPSTGELQIVPEDRNPWTNLRLNNDPADFQFAIVSDRTGGHRPGVFAEAVEQLNLLQPEFVVSVGDLIEGYSKDAEKLNQQWKEFQGYVSKLQMPFFYVPGNHDLANVLEEGIWKEKFGRRWYHFIYRDVLFLMLCTEDPPGKEGTISAAQQEWVRKVLEQFPNVRWTVVALHRPIWAGTNVAKNGWLEVEKALNGRPYTVFAGHVHRYQKFVRNGMNYYQLATTGGAQEIRGIRYGEFDHLVWVTMKKEGPVLANIMLDGIYSEDMKKPLTDESGVAVTGRRAPHPVRGKIMFEGTPTPHAQVTFHLIDAAKKSFTRTGDAFVDPDGSFVLSSYTANDGAATGEYAVTVVWRQPWADAAGKPGPSLLPDRYGKAETSGLRAAVKDGSNEFVFELKK